MLYEVITGPEDGVDRVAAWAGAGRADSGRRRVWGGDAAFWD